MIRPEKGIIQPSPFNKKRMPQKIQNHPLITVTSINIFEGPFIIRL